MDAFIRQPPRPASMLPPRPDRLDDVAAASAVSADGDTEFLWVREVGETADDFIAAARVAAAEIGAAARFEVKPRLSEAIVIPLPTRRQPGGNAA